MLRSSSPAPSTRDADANERTFPSFHSSRARSCALTALRGTVGLLERVASEIPVESLACGSGHRRIYRLDLMELIRRRLPREVMQQLEGCSNCNTAAVSCAASGRESSKARRETDCEPRPHQEPDDKENCRPLPRAHYSWRCSTSTIQSRLKFMREPVGIDTLARSPRHESGCRRVHSSPRATSTFPGGERRHPVHTRHDPGTVVTLGDATCLTGSINWRRGCDSQGACSSSRCCIGRRRY